MQGQKAQFLGLLSILMLTFVSSASAHEPDDEVLTVAVIADLNGSYGSMQYRVEVHEAVKWLVETGRPDLVITTGDMVAGQRAGLDYPGMWAAFHEAVTGPLTRAGIPLAVTPGNHDASAGNIFLDERIQYVYEWLRRRPQVRFVDEGFYPLYYAFEVGPALFISLDATLVGPLDDDQRRWLEFVLERHADKEVKIVFGHVPLYPISHGREHETLNDPALEELFDRFGVDVMVSGHHHAYYPGRRGDLRLLAAGALGSGPRRLVGTNEVGPRTVVLIRIVNGEIESIEGYGGEGFSEVIRREGLPESLNEGELKIFRDDVLGSVQK
ncbi:MAG: metallophosphoesterase family protein [Bradymonadaceae bacterium]